MISCGISDHRGHGISSRVARPNDFGGYNRIEFTNALSGAYMNGACYVQWQEKKRPLRGRSEAGNRALGVMDNGSELNGVIVSSELLAEHVRRRHPKLKLIASAADMTAGDDGPPAERYADLPQRFDTVCLSGAEGLDPDLLARLDRDRIEIVVNEDSPWPGAAAGDEPQPDDRSAMPIAAMNADVRMCNFTTAELKGVYDLGCRRFRLRGPSRNPNLFLYDLFRYTLEPNLLLPVVFKGFTNDWAREQAAAILDGRARGAGQGRPAGGK